MQVMSGITHGYMGRWTSVLGAKSSTR